MLSLLEKPQVFKPEPKRTIQERFFWRYSRYTLESHEGELEEFYIILACKEIIF